MEIRKLIAEQVSGDTERRSQFVRSNKASATIRTDNSWQQEAALFLLHSGFKPGQAIGHVEHISGSSRVGRTFGSVWREMRRLVEREAEVQPGQGAVVDKPLYSIALRQKRNRPTGSCELAIETG